jgi:hypothetical protein
MLSRESLTSNQIQCGLVLITVLCFVQLAEVPEGITELLPAEGIAFPLASCPILSLPLIRVCFRCNMEFEKSCLAHVILLPLLRPRLYLVQIRVRRELLYSSGIFDA